MRKRQAISWVVGIGIGSVIFALAGNTASRPTAFLGAPVPVVDDRIRGVRACPDDMTLAGGNCIDRYEASLVAVDADGTLSSFSPYASPVDREVRAVSVAGAVPQAHISMVDARRACEASGKRLCRGEEWVAACKGPERTRYPYGNTREPGACVDTNRRSPMVQLHGGDYSSHAMNDPNNNQLADTLAPAGAFGECTNAYGVYDMVGNLHEWVDDGTFRGGYYLDTTQNGEGCEYKTSAHAPGYYDYSTGFRCCADPKPGATE